MLRQPEQSAPLLEALSGVDRLVLLGDVLELRHGPVRDSLAVAEPVLGAIGEALGAGSEVVVVPGNHDHHLLGGWLERRSRAGPAPPFGLETPADWCPGEPLASLVRLLGPAEVRACYPGVWLRDDIYATHGHYCDRHTTVPMFERLGAGAMARIVREPTGGPARIEDYEAILAPIYAWIHAIAQHGGPDLDSRPPRSSHGASAQAWRALEGDSDDGERSGEDGRASGDEGRWASRRRKLRRRSLVTAFPALVAALNCARLGPLRADISGPELRRAALNAFGEVVARLQIDARQVIFGHTHRAGPLPADDRSEWRARSGPQLLNTGCWVHEPGFLGPRPHESPYRAGFCVTVDDEQPAELGNLLDGLTPAARG